MRILRGIGGILQVNTGSITERATLGLSTPTMLGPPTSSGAIWRLPYPYLLTFAEHQSTSPGMNSLPSKDSLDIISCQLHLSLLQLLGKRLWIGCHQASSGLLISCTFHLPQVLSSRQSGTTLQLLWGMLHSNTILALLHSPLRQVIRTTAPLAQSLYLVLSKMEIPTDVS